MRFSLLSLLAGPLVSFAAPPTVTYLYPSGGQVGSTVEVTAGGAFPKWPVSGWCSDPKIEITSLKDKGKFTVKIPAGVTPKPVWIRLHDADGASAPRPFLLGRLTEVAEKEPNDEVTKAQQVTGNAVVNGRLDKNGDVDIFRVSAKKGQTLIASIMANEVLASPVDMVVQVLSADGSVLAQDHDTHGLDPQVAFPVPNDGEYLVRVFGFPAVADSGIRLSGNDTYIYRLTLTTGPCPDHPVPLAVSETTPGRVKIAGWNIPADFGDLAATDGWADDPRLPVAVPVRLVSDLTTFTRQFIKEDEVHTHAFEGKKGQPLHVSAQSRQLGLAVTPMIRVRKPSGMAIAQAAPPQINTDSELRFTPDADGPFTVEVRDQFGAFGLRSAYLLRVRPPVPDFEATVAADRISVKPGATVDVVVTVIRKDGFTGDVLAEAEGLPAGVTLKAAPPKGKGDGKTLTLQIAAEPTAKSGPFRLILKSAGKPDLSRPVRATVPELTPATTEYLWVAVTADPAPPPKKKGT